MKIELYSFQPLPIEQRTTFELPAWPYAEDPEDYELFADYMKGLTVFRYNDSVMRDGDDLVNFAINFEVTNDLPDPFLAFKSTLAVDDEDFIIKPWPKSRGKDPMYEKLLADPIAGDMMAWFEWNLPVSISFWNKSVIKFERREEYIRSQFGSKTCKSEEDKGTDKEWGKWNVKENLGD